MSPPPSATGPRPVAATQNRQPVVSRPPPSPGPLDSVADPTLLPLFRAVDKEGEFASPPRLVVCWGFSEGGCLSAVERGLC